MNEDEFTNSSMNEEDSKFKTYLELMETRKNKRIELEQLVKAFNQWNEDNFPGQFLKMYLAVEDNYGIRKITKS